MSAWEYFNSFLNKAEADRLYAAMLNMTWLIHPDDSRGYGAGAYAMYLGKSFQSGGGARKGERGITEGWQRLADRISTKVKGPVNYIQCHRYAPHIPVTPHRDPGGMTVPMLVLGQERTFRVGGFIENEHETKQGDRKLTWHKPEDEILLRHGSLLVFNGGRTAHSMFPAKRDDDFNPDGYEWRISILFRWATDAMRKYGPGQKCRDAGGKEQYSNDINAFRKKARNIRMKIGGK